MSCATYIGDRLPTQTIAMFQYPGAGQTVRAPASHDDDERHASGQRVPVHQVVAAQHPRASERQPATHRACSVVRLHAGTLRVWASPW